MSRLINFAAILLLAPYAFGHAQTVEPTPSEPPMTPERFGQLMWLLLTPRRKGTRAASS